VKTFIKSIFLLTALILWADTAISQVTVAPVIVSMDDQNRFGSYIVQNRTDTPQEVTVDFVFGYPASDSTGQGYMIYDDPETEARLSAAPWLRAFPRAFTIAPGQQQTVRLTTRPPVNLPEGMYWSRIVTTSTAREPETGNDNVITVGARIIFRFEQITTVFFRKGQVHTGIVAGSHEWFPHSGLTGDHTILLSLQQTGNAPFLGTLKMNIRDHNNRIVHSTSEPVAIYFNMLKKVELPAGLLQPGTYTAEISLATTRNDVPPSRIVQGTGITDHFAFTVQ